MVGRAACLAVALAAFGSAFAAEPAGDESMGKPKHQGPGYLTWVGFAKRDGGARVFVRLSSAPGASIGQARAGNEVVVTLSGYKLDKRNDGRALDTRFFDTSITRVVAVPTKVGIELHIKTKAAATEATISTSSMDDGETLINFDF